MSGACLKIAENFNQSSYKTITSPQVGGPKEINHDSAMDIAKRPAPLLFD
jgi:hypothetical protein